MIKDEPFKEDLLQSSLNPNFPASDFKNSAKIHPESFSKNMFLELISPFEPLPVQRPSLRRASSVRNQTSNINSSELRIRIYCTVFLIFDLILNLLSLINLIIMTYYRLHYFDENYVDVCFTIEVIILMFFLVETINIVRDAIKKGWNNWIYIKFGSNILLIFQILWMFTHPPFLSDLHDVTILINTVRAFRIFCINNFVLGLKKNVSDEERENQKDEIRYFVLKHFLILFSAIFIEATLFLSLDYACGLEGFSKKNPYDFEYISASYYSIVTLSTIGYGDINAAHFYTRIMMMCVLFFNLSVVSLFIGRLSELIYQISPYIKNYDFKNHVIISGELPISFLKYFLLELQEIDKIQNNISISNLSTKQSTIKNILIVDSKKPSFEIECLLTDTGFSFEIHYLMDNMINKKWYSLSNLKHAKHLFLFSINYSETEFLNGQRDQSLIAMAKRIESDLKIPMTLVLSTDKIEQFQKSFSLNVTIISHNLLNNQILGNSLENPGFSTWLTHLLTLREKNIRFIPDSSAGDSNFFRLFEYAKSMTQEIYPIKLPDFFWGKTFNETAKMIYFSKKNISDKENLPNEDLDSAELIKHKRFFKDLSLLLIGVEQKKTLNNEQRKILLNPLNYIIKAGDIAYVISQNRQTVLKIFEKYNVGLKNDQRFDKTKEFYDNDKSQIKETNFNSIKKMFAHFMEKKKKWKKEIPLLSVSKDCVFDLNLAQSPRGFFSGHIIIKGNLLDFRVIIKIIRFYSERPVLIFSESLVDYSIWNKIKDGYKNVYYVRGIHHSLNHIHELDPKKAHKILVMSQNQDCLYRDTDNIVFARILRDFFKVKRVLIELEDEFMIKFLEIKPKFDVSAKDQEICYFWPSFVSGNIHYDSLLMSVAARSLFNSNWIFLLKELSIPKLYSKSQMKNENIIKENSTLCMLKITEEIAKNIVIYGKLQFLLMSHEPSIIAIALLKKRETQKIDPKKFINKMTRSQTENLGLIHQNLIRTINSVYGNKFFLTNPPYFTKLNAGDKVLVIGKDNMQQKINEKNSKSGAYHIKKMKNTIIPFADIKKSKLNFDFKSKFKENACEMIKGLNESMKKSIVCFDLLLVEKSQKKFIKTKI